jgi:hypothetical protein
MSVVDVISHPGPGRKHRRIWAYALRRLGALAITLAALAAITWAAPHLAPASDQATLTSSPQPVPPR